MYREDAGEIEQVVKQGVSDGGPGKDRADHAFRKHLDWKALHTEYFETALQIHTR